ncbi:MAG: hypothetical protein WC849_00135 [Candidatus Paceibacterota bacterium]
MKLKDAIFIIFSLSLAFALFFLTVGSIHAQEIKPELNLDFFYSETCPHCIAENAFLNKIDGKYEGLTINRFLISEEKNISLMYKTLQDANKSEYFGVVPLTFVGKEFFAGFDSEDKMGVEIEKSIQNQLQKVEIKEQRGKNLNLPILGEINIQNYSLPALAVVLGTLDGVNVCSLGALVLILGLVLKLRSRKKIFLFGGTYLIITALVYGVLIILWNKLFVFLGAYLKTIELVIGGIGLIGGVYFIKEFLRIRKQGLVCESSNSKIISSASQKIKNIFDKKGIFGMLFGIIVFSGLVTIIEFPCSAVVPVSFAGILAEKGISNFWTLIYIGMFILFYLLDEIVVFAIAVYKMDIWLTSPKFTKWASLIEGIILIALGLYYIINFI